MRLGLEAVERGDIAQARENFMASALTHATADALTYWGWMEHHLGNTAKAIELCEKAIALDPDFGNPYNDIGSYLVSSGKLDEAIPWLEKAKRAPRYEPKQFPFVNLGRIYLAKGQPLQALKEFEGALEFAPGDPGITDIVNQLRTTIN